MNISEYFSKKPKSFLMVIGVLLVLFIGVIDYLTGYEISFSIFYIIPIALIAWFVGRTPGVFISNLSALTWLLADLYTGHIYSNEAIPFWNMIMRLGIFLTVTYFITTINKLYNESEIRVQERTAQLAKSNESLLKANRAYKTHSVCNQVVVRATDESVLLHDICRTILEAGYRMALVGYAEQDEKKTVRVAAQAGYGENFLKAVNLTWADTEPGHVPLGTAIRTRTPLIFQNIADESNIDSWREAALQCGFASAIELPLITDSDILGALAIYSGKPDAFDEEEIKLLTELANDLVYGIMTLRARAERERTELEYKTILRTAMDGFWVMGTQGHFLDVNDSYSNLIGYSRDELLKMNVRDVEAVETPEETAKRIAGIIEVGGDRFETRHKCKDGRIVDIEISANYMENGGGRLFVFLRDITERKKAEEQLETSLKEKELLLREIHHRVKNNIQVISSLLNLQSEYIKEEKYRAMFKESQNRILSMSLIHEKLYQSSDLTKLDFSEYIKDLVDDLFQYYGVNTGTIASNINVENVSLEVDSAIPCGLIINELVTNSLKYAFPEGRKGELKLSLRPIDDNMVELIIGDNGIGIPEELDFRNTDSLGLHLVTILVENQLHGEISLDRSNGTEFKIEFNGEGSSHK